MSPLFPVRFHYSCLVELYLSQCFMNLKHANITMCIAIAQILKVNKLIFSFFFLLESFRNFLQGIPLNHNQNQYANCTNNHSKKEIPSVLKN
ncbi:MAG: hypothetical protein ACD_26C00150G0002 [uncultured bacterium]|nr:MAG: hypothetical protein ACD_26C00150G0002 [uncultured bacterium]